MFNANQISPALTAYYHLISYYQFQAMTAFCTLPAIMTHLPTLTSNWLSFPTLLPSVIPAGNSSGNTSTWQTASGLYAKLANSKYSFQFMSIWICSPPLVYTISCTQRCVNGNSANAQTSKPKNVERGGRRKTAEHAPRQRHKKNNTSRIRHVSRIMNILSAKRSLAAFYCSPASHFPPTTPTNSK